MNYFPFAIVEMSEGRKNLLNKSLKEKQSLEWPPWMFMFCDCFSIIEFFQLDGCMSKS